MKKLKVSHLFLSVFSLIFFSNSVGALDLELGQSPMSEALLDAMWNEPNGPFIPDAAVEVDQDLYYWLFRGRSIGLFDMNQELNVGGWPLTRWEHEPIEPEVLERFEEVRVSYDQLRMRPTHALGCLNDTPLRYGDISQDGNNELVLFIGNRLMVFSPNAQQTVFSLNMRVDDWMNEEETGWHFEYYPVGGDDSLIPYYQSAANMDLTYELPGYRGYGKIYIGDFEEAGQQDIVVWRKLYLSRTLTSERGFDKVRDSFYHFRKSVSGEYLPVETDEADIQGWLSALNLTWSQGYPRYSECEGEEGQLIPEMHDPLLNDPDVLQ